MFRHLHGSSWHGSDADLVKLVIKRPLLFVALLAVAFALVVSEERSSKRSTGRMFCCFNLLPKKDKDRLGERCKQR